MGCGSSSPSKVDDGRSATTRTETKPRPSAGETPRTKDIDVGLRDSFEYIKPLGQVMSCSFTTSERPSGERQVTLKDHVANERPLCLQGGTGQTLLYREKATGEQVAIKLIKRPIPKVIMPNILREITVSGHRQ